MTDQLIAANGAEPRSVGIRTSLLAAAGPCAGVLVMASALVAVPGTDALVDDRAGMAHVLDLVSDARDRTAVAGLITIMSVLLLVPFVCGLAHAIRRRGAAFATWGAAMSCVGFLCVPATDQFWFSNVRATAPRLADDRSAMVDFGTVGHWSLAVLGVLEVVGLFGWVLLAVGLWRSRLVSRRLAGALGLSLFVALTLPDRWAAVGGLLLLISTVLVYPAVAQRNPPEAAVDTGRRYPVSRAT